LDHPRIVHLCNVKEVAPSKRLNSKALIYLFYLFVSWFPNKHTLLQVEELQKEVLMLQQKNESMYELVHNILIFKPPSSSYPCFFKKSASYFY